jgi:hypothetical protein
MQTTVVHEIDDDEADDGWMRRRMILVSRRPFWGGRRGTNDRCRLSWFGLKRRQVEDASDVEIMAYLQLLQIRWSKVSIDFHPVVGGS